MYKKNIVRTIQYSVRSDRFPANDVYVDKNTNKFGLDQICDILRHIQSTLQVIKRVWGQDIKNRSIQSIQVFYRDERKYRIRQLKTTYLVGRKSNRCKHISNSKIK